MFHKFAVIFNIFIVVLPWFVYFLGSIRLIERSELFISFFMSYMSLANVLYILHFLVLVVFFSVLFTILVCSLINIKVGPPPPMRSCTIAYKYGLSNTVTSSAIKNDNVIFPDCDKIQICYENKGFDYGIAHGAMISDQINENVKSQLGQEGYSVFHTMNVSNAMYISCPKLPWLSYFGIWLILFIVYPRFYKFSKIHRLSAYPVVEMYRSFSIIIMAPLSKQDLFIVPEAESLISRSCSGINSTFSTTTNLSRSSLRLSRSQSADSNISNICNGGTKPESFHSSTPLCSNGIVKQGYED